MANIKKSFSFRNGVQVDDDNFLVNPTGLVGIGTTVPTEALDVRGKVKVIGEVNATSGLITSLVISDTLQVNNLDFAAGEIGAGISVGTAGIITASTSTGIVTYFGDGAQLQNLPTSQWLDKDVGLGYTSIYSQGAVGIGTIDPRFFLQVGGNESNLLATFEAGVGFTVPLKTKTDYFIGKESLIKRKENPQKKLVGLELISKEKANHGDCVHISRSQVGVVTSGCISPTLNKNIALCRIDIGHSKIGTEVEVGKIDGEQKRIAAKVVEFPHYDPKKTRVRG